MLRASLLFDLEYESGLETLLGVMASRFAMGATTFMVWLFFTGKGKGGHVPIWADFPTLPFVLGMFCLWLLGRKLAPNYQVRYQLNSQTQQLDLVRIIFGKEFKQRVAGFDELHSTAIAATWSDDKNNNRSWSYALCLVTRAGRIVRVSDYASSPPRDRAREVADKLGIECFHCPEEPGTLKAQCSAGQGVRLYYKPAPRCLGALEPFLIAGVFLIVMFSLAYISSNF
ncbi:MAG: hypothetical protein U0931_13170 [Vulcanimicrobiota bacterium]